MCASYGAASEFNLLQKTLKVEFPPISIGLQQIVYPHTSAPVILSRDRQIRLQAMNYSLIPQWSKVRKPKFSTYNARIEEVLKRPSWKKPFESKHCLVPMTEFYEAVHVGRFAGHKIAIANTNQEALIAAGIWDTWRNVNTGEVVDSFAILTADPTPQILDAGHDRCPIFLTTEAANTWITDSASPDSWVRFLKENRADIEFGFTQKEPLKNYSSQLSLFSDSE